MLLNSFSFNMLEPGFIGAIRTWPASREGALEAYRNGGSAIGHADTARIISSLLGEEIPTSRITVQLVKYQTVVVAQYIGPRLPEGATELPEEATIEFRWVEIT